MTLNLTPGELKELTQSGSDEPYLADQYDEDRRAELLTTLRQTADWFDESAEAIAEVVERIPLGARAKANPVKDLRGQIERLRKRATLLRAEVERMKGGAS